MKDLDRLARLLNESDELWNEVIMLLDSEVNNEEESLDLVLESTYLLFEFIGVLENGAEVGACVGECVRVWDDMYVKECIVGMLNSMLNEYSMILEKEAKIRLVRKARELNDECAKMVGLLMVGCVQ